MADMREVIREKTGLAQIYADDGAYHSAARVLNDLAVEVKAHAEHATREIEKLMKQRRG